MPEIADLLEREAAGYSPPPDLLDRVRDRGRRRERNRRAGSGLAAVLVIALSIVGVSKVLPRSTVLFEQPADPWIGTWESIDTDGSSQTMRIRAQDDARYSVVVTDDAASVCAGASSTMTGTGRLEGAGLVLAAPQLTCDDGATPSAVDGSSLAEALRDYTLVHDAEIDTLADNMTVTWSRPGVTPDPQSSEGPASGEVWWPQSTVEEVRDAQERADAGDPDVAWQVDADLSNDTAPPGDAAIFKRYLQEERGWTDSRWGDQVEQLWTADCGGGNAGPGCTSYQIGFVRCATAQPNPLYPKDAIRGNVPGDADGTTCAPTVDEATYETLTVVIRQPLRNGPKGIWVVTDSYPGVGLRQTAPLPEAAVTGVVEDVLQARVDGEGAEDVAQFTWADAPLRYFASDGSSYDRFDYQLHGPLWPWGTFNLTVRLYAGDTVVSQKFGVEDGGNGRVRLEYEPRSTTVNGQGLPEPYDILDGEVAFGVAPPWYGFFDYGPDTIALNSGDDRQGYFSVVPDPLPVGTGCAKGDAVVDAQALAQAIRSDPDLDATRPVAETVGGAQAVRMDVVAAPGASVCADWGTPLVVSGARLRAGPSLEPGARMRLYLLDLPKGMSARTLAIAFAAPQAAFESVLDDAPRILRSFEFRTP